MKPPNAPNAPTPPLGFRVNGELDSGLRDCGQLDLEQQDSFQHGPLPPNSSDATSDGTRIENWLGRKAIGVVASILVFLGLVVLGTAVVPQLTDEMKATLMFALSGTLSAAGSALAIYRKNGFTATLMGCGMGSLFISVLVTHLHFGYIGEYAAFGIILVWMVTCLALARKTQSLLLAVVLQIGTAVSVCLGFSSQMDGAKMAFALVYQIAANVIVVGGNLLFYRRLYRGSLALSLVLGIVVSCFIWRFFGGWSSHAELDYPLAWIVAAFAIQLLTAVALSALMASSILGNSTRSCQTSAQEEAPPNLALTPGRSQVEEAESQLQLQGDSHAQPPEDPRTSKRFGTECVRQDLREHERGSSAWLAIATGLLVVAVRLDVFHVAERCLHPVFTVGSHNWVAAYRAYVNASAGAFLVATAIMLIAIAVLTFALVRYARRADGKAAAGSTTPSPAITPALLVLFAGGTLATLHSMLVGHAGSNVAPYAWMWVWALYAVALWRQMHDERFRIAAVSLVAIDVAFLALSGFPKFIPHLGELAAAFAGAAYVVGLAGFAGLLVLSTKRSPERIVVFAIICTILLMSYLYHCTPLVGEGWQWSLCCMACALACIIMGFATNIGGLRLYGLILALACVAKLVGLDIVDLDSLARSASLVVGGVICFAISALYSFAVRMKLGAINQTDRSEFR